MRVQFLLYVLLSLSLIACAPKKSFDFAVCSSSLAAGMTETEVKDICGSPTMRSTSKSGRIMFNYLRGPMDMRSDGLHVAFESDGLVDFGYFDPASGQRITLNSPSP